MTEKFRPDGPSFGVVARGVIALSKLIALGRGEGPEADAIRDALDVPLSTLTRAERERARWLAEDLYSLSELAPDRPLPPIAPRVRDELKAIADLGRRGQLDEALALLRRSQAYLPLVTLCEWRGSLWREAGQREVATAFLDRAAEIKADHVHPATSSVH